MQKEKLIRNNKGITLVALVITIILMLILAGVSIDLSMDGGLFNRAAQATSQSQIALDRKIILSEVVLVLQEDGKVNFQELDKNLQNKGFEKTDEKKYKSPKGNVFIVDDYGDVKN